MKKEISFSEFSEELFEKIDISPSQYKTAVSHYEAVAQRLVDCESGEDIYVQGSFALGTVVRPFKGGKDADFDLDIVCQGAEAKTDITPRHLKMRVKECIKKSPYHSKLLSDEEGRRCWTLNYAPSDDGVGFHMDILPCLPEDVVIITNIKQNGVNTEYADNAIAITDKDKDVGSYNWSNGNPRGYAKWFGNINEPYLTPVAAIQKKAMVERHAFASIADVPKPLLRSALQRVIQLLKRHRDCRFDGQLNEDNKPISIIITTLVAQIAHRLSNYYATVGELLQLVVNGLAQYAPLIEKDFEHRASLLPRDYFTRASTGWVIPNPVNPFENFAERWAENNHAKARAFFQWLTWVKEDFDFDGKDSGAMFKSLQAVFGAELVSSVYRSLELNPMIAPIVFMPPSKENAPKPYKW